MKKRLILTLVAISSLAMHAEDKKEGTMDATLPIDSMASNAQNTLPEKSEQPKGIFSQVQKALDNTNSDIKFGGFIIGKYSINDRKHQSSNSSFDLRLVRLYADGHAFKDFYYRLQLEVNGAPDKDKGPRIVDAFVEWQKYKEFRVAAGQFKRSFGFENHVHPLNVGLGSYSLATMKLTGFADRVGEHSSYGCDQGVQVQGDILPAADGHRWLHYQVGLFNGQGINHSDKDNHKDLIGGIWVSPLKGARIGGFGWNGKYVNEGYMASAKGADYDIQLKSVNRQRWAVSAEYEGDWMVRSEYMWSKGKKIGRMKNGMDAEGVQLYKDSPNYADAWYVEAGTPKVKGFKLMGRWDCYRDNKKWNSLKQIYELSLTYYFNKNLFIQAEYDITHDKTLAEDRTYNTFGVQVYCRF